METVTVLDMITAYLLENGYTGLYRDDDCGCALDDLVPCDGDTMTCSPGMQYPCDCGEGCRYHVGPRRP